MTINVSTENLSFASLVFIAKELSLDLNFDDLVSKGDNCSYDEKLKSSIVYDRVFALMEVLCNLYQYRPLPF